MNLPVSLARLVKIIETAIETNTKMTPLKAKELVISADVQVEDMIQYADFDHPVADCYGRKLVFDNGQFEVMVMSWCPGDYSSIHNHGYTQWGVVQAFGNAHHLIYQIKDNEMSFAKKEIVTSGEAVKVNNALIHQMGNSTTQGYLTLHVYGVNGDCPAITADAKNYDLELDRIAHTCGGAFFNLSEDAIHSVEAGVEPTQAVFSHYSHLLMDYYNRQIQTPEIIELKAQLLRKMEASIFEHEEVLV